MGGEQQQQVSSSSQAELPSNEAPGSCPGCQLSHDDGGFWVCCDHCEAWWCGDCTGMDEGAAQVEKWACRKCLMKG